MVPQDIIRYIMVKYAPYVILTCNIQKSWVNIGSGVWWHYDMLLPKKAHELNLQHVIGNCTFKTNTTFHGGNQFFSA